jgi:starch-binding outer membrane protein, SusD/RagB family
MNLLTTIMKTGWKQCGMAVLSGVLVCSCNSFLDVKPVDRTIDALALTSSTNVERVLLTSYDRIQDGGFSGNSYVMAELYAGEVSYINALTGDAGDFATRNFGIFNGLVSGVWEKGYSSIHKANLVIGAVNSKSFPASADQYALLQGEAFFLRAFAHFELVRLFALPIQARNGAAPGIPLRTYAPNTEEAYIKVPRAPVSVVYGQVKADLKLALDLLPTTNLNIGRVDRVAALALLARVYHSANQFDSAFIYSDQALKAGGLSLDTSVGNVLTPFRFTGALNARPTVAFQIVNQSNDDGSGRVRDAFWNVNGGTSVFLPLTVAINADPAVGGNVLQLLVQFGGQRLTEWIKTDQAVYSQKFGSVAALNQPFIRTAELYLIRAEALVNKSSPDFNAALADLNVVRNFAGAPLAILPASTADFNQLLFQENRMEFVAEGHFFHELRRRGLPIRGLASDNSATLVKIPNSELRGNPEMVQN